MYSIVYPFFRCYMSVGKEKIDYYNSLIKDPYKEYDKSLEKLIFPVSGYSSLIKKLL